MSTNLFETPAEESLFSGGDDPMRRLRQAVKAFLRHHEYGDQRQPQDVVATARLLHVLVDRHLGDGPMASQREATLEVRLDAVVLALTGRHVEVMRS